MVPLPKKRSRADTVIACTPRLNLRHPAGAIAPTIGKLPQVQHQHITWIWLWTQPGARASQGWWRPECSSSKGQWRLQCSSIPKGYYWGSVMVYGGNHDHKDSLANHIWWEVLDCWWSFETSHRTAGSSAGISRCSCRYTKSVSIARWSISENWSANPSSGMCSFCLILLHRTYDDDETPQYV